MPSLTKLLCHIALVSSTLMVSMHASRPDPTQKVDLLEAYSFDFSEHKAPIAYETFDASVELFTRTKLIPPVNNKYGAVFLKKVTISHFSFIVNSNSNRRYSKWMWSSLCRAILPILLDLG